MIKIKEKGEVIAHLEKIECPECGLIQLAEVEHTEPWWSYVHECKCGYLIGESEWDKIGD